MYLVSLAIQNSSLDLEMNTDNLRNNMNAAAVQERGWQQTGKHLFHWENA